MTEFRYSSWASGVRKSEIAEFIAAAKESGMLSLCAGIPYPGAYPTEKVADITGTLIKNNPEVIFPYGNPQGSLRSREAVVYRMKKRGTDVLPENVVMTSGSQNACDMLMRLILEPGDTLVIEAPTFLGVLDSIKNLGLNLVEVPIDNDGIRTDILRETLSDLRKKGTQPKAIYLMSNYHNPAGIMLNVQRKKELPEIAEEFDCYIIEDDAYSELVYDDVDQRAVKAFDSYGRVLYLGSFSKLVSPGFRVGWAVVPDEFVETWNICRPMFDVGSPQLNQEIIAELHVDNWLDSHIEKLKRGYGSRRDTLLGALEKYMPDGVTWTKAHGGFYSWVTVPESVNLDNLIGTALKNKVIYFKGNFFYLDNCHHNNFRLCYSRPEEDVIVEAVKRIAIALKEEMAN